MEETVGKLWDRWIRRLARSEHPHAAVRLDDVRLTVGIVSRALGGDGGLRVGAAAARRHGARRRLLNRLSGTAETAVLASLDDTVLRLPATIDLFADRALNSDLYLWLAALAATAGGGAAGPNPFLRNQHAARRTLQVWPGLAGRYERLLLSCVMHSFAGMCGARLLVGMACGIVLASGNAIAASALDPARYYMKVLALQSALTIFIWSAMPKLLTLGSQYGVFGGSAVALGALAMVMMVSGTRHSNVSLRSPHATPAGGTERAGHADAMVVAIALLSVFACCMRDGVAWTFSDRIAIEVGLSDLGQTLLYAGIGALGLVVLLASAQLNIWKRPVANVAGAIILASATTTGLLFSHHWLVFVALALPWAAVQFLALSFLTGLSAELDPSGRLSAATGAAFQCAYAVAPGLAGMVFVRLGYVAVGGLAAVASLITLVAGTWLAGKAVAYRRVTDSSAR